MSVFPSAIYSSEATTELYLEPNQLHACWQHYAEHGRHYKQQGHSLRAAEKFSECIRISQLLIDSKASLKGGNSACELLYFSSHNLSACFNCLHRASEAELKLRSVYKVLFEVMADSDLSKTLRLEALAVMDRCLFSLCSQLAYMGKISKLYQLIERTESLVKHHYRQINLPTNEQ